MDQPPQNLAIYISRRSRKREVFLNVYTLKGFKELRNKHLSKRQFKKGIQMGTKVPPESELKARLVDFIRQHGEGKMEQVTGTDAELTERALWERAISENKPEYEVDTLTELWFGTISKGRRKQVEELL